MASAAFEVVYLTGAPASGKSTATTRIKEIIQPLEVFDYGDRLRSYVAGKDGRGLTYDQLRRQSAHVITPADVAELDEVLIAWVEATRLRAHVIIDTHAVTRESFGFRVTAFSAEQIRRLRPTQVVVLFVPPEVAVERIAVDAAGRRSVTAFEAGFHTALQGSVAIAYGIEVGRPVYFLDASRGVNEVADELRKRLGG